MKLYAILIFTLVGTSSSYGKKFSNNYIEFELPNGWSCNKSGLDWYCQSLNQERKKEAIIILVGKGRLEEDNLKNYTKYLKKKKSWALPSGKIQISDPKYVSKRMINQTEWVDSLHLASEVPGFYTRYLAGLKGSTAVAMTFSVHRSVYQDYREVMDKTLNSIKVFGSSYRPGKDVSKTIASLKSGEEGSFGLDSIQGAEYGNVGNIKVQKRSRSNNSGDSGAVDFLLYLLIAGIGGFLYYKKKIEPKKKSSNKKTAKNKIVKKTKKNLKKTA